MRIVGGKHKGRRLKAPRDQSTRPTAERVREALFNILAHADYAEGAPRGMKVLDAFAGSGTLGFEALSRGAERVIFLERNAQAARLIEENAAMLGEMAHVSVLRRDVARPGPASLEVDLVLMDAPYGKGLTAPAIEALAASGWLAPTALLAVELGAGEAFAPPAGFNELDSRRYGAARIVILQAE